MPKQWRIRLSLFDKTGLDAATVTNLRLLIVSVMGGVIFSNITTGVAMSGYLKELRLSDSLYGIVFALPSLFNAFQFIASLRMERTLRRRRMFLISGFIQRLIWVPFALIPFFIPLTQPQLRLAAILVCTGVSAASAPFMNVAFYSLCADVVPMRIRGRYFAVRSRVSTSAGLAVGLAVGYLLDALPGFQGYLAVFLLAALCGALDVLCFIFMPLPAMRPPRERPRLWVMVRSVLRDKPYMGLVAAMTAWNFAVQTSSPYYNVYMREGMGMSNMGVMVLGQITSNLFLILFVQRWGRMLDGYGNKPVLLISAFLTSLMPFLFTPAMPGMLWLVFIANALSGATYCAIDLSAQNLFLGQPGRENRTMYIAIYFLFTQLLGTALGSAAGGFLLDTALHRLEALPLRVAGFTLTRYNYLFALSGALRMLVVFLLFTRLREEGARAVRDIAAAARGVTLQRLHGLRISHARRIGHRRERKARGRKG